MIYLRERSSNKPERGDAVIVAQLPGRRVTLSRSVFSQLFNRRFGVSKHQLGFTLIELVITITVLTILTMGV
ncbi:MAG TPA: prepilin-type N-terminal cleavage/methylation domain-containing protein, partial [Pyrinomonadaceae bacterium]